MQKLIPFLLLGVISLSACGKNISKNSDSLALLEASLLSIDSPPEGSFITTANFETFTLSGTCGYNGGIVTVQTDIPVMGNATCIANAWSVTLDVSFLFDGILTFDVSHVGPFGEPTVPVSRSYVKDTLSPNGASIIIGDGITIPTAPAVVLTLSAVGATKMYITNVAGCTSGGMIEPYSTTKDWNLAPVGTTAKVYAIFSDDAGNTSACVSATTEVNFIIPPTGTIAINNGAASTTSTSVTLTLNSAAASEMYITNTSGCVSGGAFEAYSTSKNWTLGQASGTATVYVKFKDLAGTVGPCVSDQIFVGMQPLAISPASIALSSGSAHTTTFTASGGTIPYTFAVVSGPGSINSSSGVYTVAAGATGTTLIRVTDSAENTADAVVTHTELINLTGCYDLQVIGMKEKSASLTDSNRRSLFVSIDGTSKILLKEGTFKVLDGNGTDGSAEFSLPASGYSVYMRLVGKPGSDVDMKTCGIDPLDLTKTYCSQTTLRMDRPLGTSNSQDVSQDLLSVYADIDSDGGVDRVPLFSSSLDGYYWNTDADGRIHAQLKFCPISL